MQQSFCAVLCCTYCPKDSFGSVFLDSWQTVFVPDASICAKSCCLRILRRSKRRILFRNLLPGYVHIAAQGCVSCRGLRLLNGHHGGVLLKTEHVLNQTIKRMCYMHVAALVCSERNKHAGDVLMRPSESLLIHPYLCHSDVFDLFLIQSSRLTKLQICIQILLKPHTRPQKLAPAPTS